MKRFSQNVYKEYTKSSSKVHSNYAYITGIANTLSKQINQEIFEKKYTPIKEVLILVGAGAFIGASLAIPTFPLVLRPFLRKKQGYNAWKRFNIPYLKRSLHRLEKQKLVEFDEKNGKQIVRITDIGGRKILRYALEELAIQKPKMWDRKWHLVSYDIPNIMKYERETFHEWLVAWGFYPLHHSVFLHAYPCEKEVTFLREYIGISEYVRIFTVSSIENDLLFREFFGV